VRKLPTLLLCLAGIYASFDLASAQVQDTQTKTSRRITADHISALIAALAEQPKGRISIYSLGLFPSAPSQNQSTPPRQLPAPDSPLLTTAVETVNQENFKAYTKADPDRVEIQNFTTQLWSTLERCGYKPYFPDGSHGLPDEGVTIRVRSAKARVLAEALRECLLGSGITRIHVEEDPKDEAYLEKYIPTYNTLLNIEIGNP
jgi:hypothetical protein